LDKGADAVDISIALRLALSLNGVEFQVK